MQKLEKKSPTAIGQSKKSDNTQMKSNNGFDNNSKDILTLEDKLCTKNAQKSWLENTVQKAIDQGHRPIPMVDDDQGIHPKAYGANQRYEADNPVWDDCLQDIVAIALDDFILVDYDGNKPDGAAPLAEVFDILGDKPNVVQTNENEDSLHFLYRKPAHIDKATLKNSNDGWLHGVDIKTMNQLMYLKQRKTIIDDELPTLEEVEDAPQAIIDALTKVTTENLMARSESSASKLQAAEILTYINPDCIYPEWLSVGMGLHDEFNGDDVGLEVWDNLSAKGDNYAGFSLLRYKWNSFKKGGGTTFASVCQLAKENGADLSAISKKYDENGELLPTYGDLLAEAKKLDDDSNPELINALALKMGSLGAIEMQMVAKVIKKNTGTSLADLRKIAKDEERAKRSAAITASRSPKAISPINIESFPDVVYNEETGVSKVLATIPNIETMLDNYGISTYYDVIKKKVFVNAPMVTGSPDNIDNTSMTACVSLAKLNQLPSEQVPEYIFAIADTNQRNPVADWITERVWDGIDRLPDIYRTLTLQADYPEEMRNTLVRHWLISAVAAALKPIGFKARGVLTLQGEQSIGKTSWLESLVPDLQLRKQIVKTDHLLDPSDKDSVMGAVSHWLVELGELDSTFKKDVARLKGFITADMDKLRRPYARLDSEYQRRTVFFGSVNDNRFLVDDTGNTRFWTIAVESIDFKHGIDMQQLWAQVKIIYDSGEQWWLTREEENQLEELNKGHRVMPAIRELIQGYFNFDSTDQNSYIKMSAAEVVKAIGYVKPTNAQTKEAGSALRELLGEPTKSKGLSRWNVPPSV